MSMYSSPMLQWMKEIPILILILKNFIKQSKNRKTYFTFSFDLFNVSELGFPSAWSSVVSAFALASCSAFITLLHHLCFSCQGQTIFAVFESRYFIICSLS